MEQEKVDRRRRSSEQATAIPSGNMSRRSSQLADCGSWDCERRGVSAAAKEEDTYATGPRRMRGKATWTPEARSRTGSWS